MTADLDLTITRLVFSFAWEETAGGAGHDTHDTLVTITFDDLARYLVQEDLA